MSENFEARPRLLCAPAAQKRLSDAEDILLVPKGFRPAIGRADHGRQFGQTAHVVEIMPKNVLQQRKFAGFQIGEISFRNLSARQVILSGFAENGFRQFATVGHPITCVADLKGLKMRVINTNLLTSYMSALGANPTALAYTEIYSGLQNKVIDGEEINISSCASQKHYDVVNYISVANMYCFPATYWMSGKTYRSISEEDFNLIKGAFMDGAERCFDTLLYELDDAFLQECIDAGVEVNYIEGDALKEFQDIAEPFLEDARNSNPKVAAMIDYALSVRGQ